MPKVITDSPVTGANGKPFMVPVFDDDGNVKWKVKPADATKDNPAQVERTAAKSSDLYRLVLRGLGNTREVQAQNDSAYSAALWNDLLAAKDSNISIKEKVYDWAFRVLNRSVPFIPPQGVTITEEQKKAIHELPFSVAVFGLIDAACLVEQMKVPEERRDWAQDLELKD